MAVLSQLEIESFVYSTPGWVYEHNSIQKKFELASQSKAFQFIIKVAQIAEEMDHHPEWSGIKNIVCIKLYSHDANTLTTKDIVLAKKIEEIV